MLAAALLFTTDLPGTFDELEGELKTWHVIWKEKPEDELPFTVLDTIFLPLMDFYPNIKRLLLIFATIPVTTCISERSFSSLKRIKTYLRSTMGENRLNGLALLNIHPEIIINPEEVVDIIIC
uniref:Repressor of the inhibitor of the protein kinase n=1 Tax=Schizaphis graminum TaxID=13262 RepID=A0A2S2NV27_SCHGA